MQSLDFLWLLWRLIGITLHIVAFTLDLWVVWRNLDNKSGNRPAYAPWKFLTFWCLLTQLLTYTVCIVCDFLESSYSKSPKISEPFNSSESINQPGRRYDLKLVNNFIIALRDRMVLVVSFPLAIFVTCMFWGLYCINPSLVVPPDYARNVPPFVNHVQHTLITPFILAEIILCYHQIPTLKSRFSILATYITAYGVWLFILGFVLNSWPYPIFEKLPWWGTVLFNLATAAAMFVVQAIGIKLAEISWNKGRIEKFYRSHSESYSLSRRHITEA